jgi:hypothetical protein
MVPVAERRRCSLVPKGWVCWFVNRRVDLRTGWLRLTVQR